jgi:phosphoglycolate phosphatase-like HAD superfamily hydrolase
VRTGGFGAEELEAAGAAHVADSLEDLHDADWVAFVARGA